MYEILRNPREIGAGCPSLPKLAKTMADFVPLTYSGYIVELGAGTGSITKALLNRGITPASLIAIEQMPSLGNCLHRRFPKIQVILGDAQNLFELLEEKVSKVNVIISSLPFRSLKKSTRESIIQQIDEVLPNNGLIIQFTYQLTGKGLALPNHFISLSHKIVWDNLPPARVDIYQSKKRFHGISENAK